MNEIKMTPPQPIPYPDHPIIKKLYRLPNLVYRLGLDGLIGRYILILSTFGRKTGKIHRTPVEYFRHGNRLFVISGFGTNPDWYQNLLADPHVSINTHQGTFHAIARKPVSKQEWDGVMAFIKASPITKLSRPGLVNRLDNPDIRLEIIQTWTVITFDPTHNPAPPALEADLIWTWPLILLSAALMILAKWLRHQRD